MRKVSSMMAAAVCLLCTGCVTDGGGDTVQFQAKKTQQVVMRDGASTITSRALKSIVTMRSAERKVGSRPVFIVGIQNISRQQLEFRLGNVSAMQIVGGQPTVQLKVFTYDELVEEEKNAQVGRAVMVGVLGGVGAGLAGKDQYLQNQSAYQTSLLATQVHVAGQQNLEALEQLTIKDQTLMPGETYAGKLFVQAPEAQNGNEKVYSLTVQIGPDRHEILISQGS
jgi:hypothetical protein